MISKKLFMIAIIISVSILYQGCIKQTMQKNSEEILKQLEPLSNVDEKIRFLEQKNIPKVHILRYKLAYLYIEKGDVSKAQKILEKDVALSGDLLFKYESYALLMALYLDNSGDINDAIILKYDSLFNKMMRAIKRDIPQFDLKIKTLEKKIAADASGNSKFKDEINELLGKKALYQRYLKDPYQYERLAGDFYFLQDKKDKALLYYSRFLGDLDKPVEYFVPDTFRRYIGLLLEKKDMQKALLYQGYLVNLQPYMFSDLMNFADLYRDKNDPVSTLLMYLFINTLAEDYDKDMFLQTRIRIQNMLNEMNNNPENEKIINLATIFITGDNINSIPFIINGYKKLGYSHFFFTYLEGVAHFVNKNYVEAEKKFVEFNSIYPYSAESQYFLLQSMLALVNPKETSAERNKRTIDLAENVIFLKPASQIAANSRIYLGTSLGLTEKESKLLITGKEIYTFIKGYVENGAPVTSLKPLIDSLTIPKNAYQVAVKQILGSIKIRTDELKGYLKLISSAINAEGKRNIEEILAMLP